jgi:hypothetical protein
VVWFVRRGSCEDLDCTAGVRKQLSDRCHTVLSFQHNFELVDCGSRTETETTGANSTRAPVSQSRGALKKEKKNTDGLGENIAAGTGLKIGCHENVTQRHRRPEEKHDPA